MNEMAQALISHGIITADDVQRYSTLELLMMIIDKINLLSTSLAGQESGIVPFRLPGEKDDTPGIQRIIDANLPVYVNRNLIVSDTIKLKPTSMIRGIGKNNCSIEMTDDDKFMLSLETEKRDDDYDLVSSLTVADLCLKGRYILRINEQTEVNFSKLGHIKGGVIQRVYFNGKQNEDLTLSDVPTHDELKMSGVGIQATKVFDMAIRDCEIHNCGIGIDFLGCDINIIDNCRIGYNLRQFHSKRISTYGSQNKLKNCDVMWGKAKGHVYLEGTWWDTIEDNYFESYNENGLFMYIDATRGTTIINNRIDTNKSDTYEVEIYPFAQYQFIHNRSNTSEVLVKVKVSPIYFNAYEKERLGLCKDNVGFYIYDIPPLYQPNQADYYYSSENPHGIQGQILESYPFEKRDGVWKIKQTYNKNIGYGLYPKATTGSYVVRYETFDKDGELFLNIRKNSLDGEILVGKSFPKGQGEIPITADLKCVVVEMLAHVGEMKYLEIVPIYTGRQ